MPSKIIKIVLILLLSNVFFPLSGTTQEKQTETKKKIEIPSSVKEELHRYMGYEDLLPKYLSLPYDVTMNTNVRGSFLDLSYLFLIFLPIILFMGLKNKWLKLGLGIFMLVFLCVSTITGYAAWNKIQTSEVSARLQLELTTVSFGSQPIHFLKIKLSLAAYEMYKVIDENFIQIFSGEGDAITYPIFFLLFIAAYFVFRSRLKENPIGENALVYLGLLYCFLWIVLGAGVTYYGILMVALGLVFIGVGALGQSKKEIGFKYLKYTFLIGSIFWLGMAFTYRMSNYVPDLEPSRNGAIHIAPLFYGLGKKNKAEVLDELFPGYRPVIEQINNDPKALVYRAGTYFQYFITRNTERVTFDNQLEFFNDLSNNLSNKVTLAKALKKTGYNYLLIDINLAGIDSTPEQSLKKKAQKLQDFLVNNPAIEPIGTDRVIQTPNGQYVYGFSGGEVKNIGTFIAFKIK